MLKKKTLKEQGLFFKDIPVVKLKKDAIVNRVNTTRKMKNKKYISKILWDCLVNYDLDGFKEVLRTHLELTNKKELAKEIGVSKRTFFRMLSEKGNPTLENISKLIHKICA